MLTEEVPTVQSFALGIWVDSGTRDEDTEHAGIAHFVEHAVFRRSATRSSKQIAAEFEQVGAYINAFTSKEQTCYYVRALTPHLAHTTRLLADVVMNPAFRESEVEKERSVILEEIKSYDDEPEELVMDMGERLLFGRHQLGSPIIGTADSVAGISAADLRAFHAANYVPEQIVVAAAGNLNHDDVCRVVEQQFASLPSPANTTPAPVRRRSVPRQLTPRRITHHRGFQQAHICCIRRCSGARSAERYPLALLNAVLGDGMMSSRLHQRIRERSGSAYTVYSSLQLLTDCGILSVYAGADAASIEKTDHEIQRELRLLAEGGVGKRELQRAKEQLKSSTIMGLESMSSRMQSLAKAEMEEDGYEDTARTIAAIDAVSTDQIAEAAERYFQPDQWSYVVMLPEG